MQILALHSKRPVGVNILTSGGLKAVASDRRCEEDTHGSRWGTK